MDKLWRENKRPNFRVGRMFAEGRPVRENDISMFLASEEGKAAIQAAEQQRRRRGNRSGDRLLLIIPKDLIVQARTTHPTPPI